MVGTPLKVIKNLRPKHTAVAPVILVLIVSPVPTYAGGIFGNALETICGNCGLGKELDRRHAQLGSPLDVPGRVLRESEVETLGPALAVAIQASRDNAHSAGVEPIPQKILNALAPSFNGGLLADVRYRVGQGHELSVQANSMRFGDAIAVSLIDTVVFRSTQDAETNISLWAHELTHIDQYRRWGLLDFSKRYVRNYEAVEKEAEDRARRISQSLSIPYAFIPEHIIKHYFLLQTGTALHETGGDFDFVIFHNADVVAIKKSGTGSKTTEVHILSAKDNYQKFRLQTGTALHETGDTFDFVALGNDDIAAIKKSGTGSRTTEVHILSAKDNYQKFRLQTGTALHETGSNFTFVAASGGQLGAIKKSVTGTNSTEVHVVKMF